MPINPKYTAIFEADNLYHVYNRAHKGLKLFYEPEDYLQLLFKIEEYIAPYADIYAFSLLPNHFHIFFHQNHVPFPLFINKTTCVDDFMYNQFRKLFIGHTRMINHKYDRYGGLFCTPYRRINVETHDYALQLLYYIHWNHVHHDLGKTLMDYPYSSYSHYLFDHPTFIKKETVFNWFDGKENFIKQHQLQKDRYIILPDFL